MQVKIEDVGPCKKKLLFELPSESIQQELEKSFGELQTSAVIPGFRVGHAPRKLIENRFGKDVKEDVKNRLIGSSYDEAVKEHKLKPLGAPDIIEESIEYDPASGLKFAVSCEVAPDFNLPEYKGLELTRPATAVTDPETTEALDNLRRRNAVLEPVSAPAQPGDVPVVDCLITCEGKEIQNVQDRQFSLSDDNWLGGIDRSFWKRLEGKKAGDSVTGDVTLPDGWRDAALRGKTATVSITVKDVKRPRLPELDDEFAKDLLFKDLEELKSEVRSRLASAKERHARETLAAQATEKLLAAVSFDLPEDLLKHQAERLALRQKLDLAYRGLPPDEIEKVAETIAKGSASQSERDMRVFFLFRRIADSESIEVSDAELEARITDMARARGQRPPQLHEELQQQGELETLRGEILDEKVVNLLLASARITDAEPAPASEQAAPAPTDSEEKPGKEKKEPRAKSKKADTQAEEEA